jgi:Tol biopolymer transport system component
VVTEPVVLAQELQQRTTGWALHSTDEEVSFVSYPTGALPEADTAVVRNRTRDLETGGPIQDGGLDPVPVPASIGDTLVIVTYRQGLIFSSEEREVPERNPPVIVRTDPPRGKTRVPLNSFVVVVFSEPVDGTTVTTSTVRLLRDGTPVTTALDLAADGINLAVSQEGGLEASSTYTVVVETELADRIGDTLESQFTSDFETVPAQLQGEIVFESGRSGNNEVWTMKADGTDFFQITDRVAGGVATAPALSPDGRKVAFSLAEPASGDDWDIYVINVDGTGLTNLTNHPEFDGWRPAWSPDGSQIAFFSTRDDPINDEVYVMDADGSNVRRLTDNPADDANMTWSPDGTRIAWETNREGDFDIWIMNADGSNPTGLTVDPADDEWPAWSPDGTKIAFDTFRDGNSEIYVINVDGTGLTNLTNDPGFDSAAAWSKDGSQIAFISDRGGAVDIWVMDADGSDPVNLTNDGWSDFFPSWSP